MSAMKGYYSVVQYCPDASRLEAANIGVLLLCPEVGFVRARTAEGNDRIRRFFKGRSFDLARVNAAKKSIERRVEIDKASFRAPEDLVRFIDTRGNDIVLTQPRPMKVLDPEADLDALFQELVGGRARRPREQAEIPALDLLFRRPSLRGRIVFNPPVVVPVVGRPLKVPYAFRNSVLNLVKPQRFAPEEKRTTATALQLAIEGDLLFRHPEAGESRKLIVVSTFDQNGSIAQDLRSRVHSVLCEYHVRVVQEEEIDQFAAEVEREARA